MRWPSGHKYWVNFADLRVLPAGAVVGEDGALLDRDTRTAPSSGGGGGSGVSGVRIDCEANIERFRPLMPLLAAADAALARQGPEMSQDEQAAASGAMQPDTQNVSLSSRVKVKKL